MRKYLWVVLAMIATLGIMSTGCEKEVSVTVDVYPDSNLEETFASIEPGTTVIFHEGEYKQFELDSKVSGTKKNPVKFAVAEGEKVVVKPEDRGVDEEGYPVDSYGIHVVNADNITIDGFEIQGGTHGVYYESTPEYGDTALENVTISNCTVHGIRGVHGICVYARNDLAPVKNLTMDGCTVYDCECDSSESTVFNGNIDGFIISNNVIHDNNNIGIDMIGFEGNAKHTDEKFDNPYDADYVRNGKCYGNVVYNISAEGNQAYYEDGEYDLCADGIYVDGGQKIEIYNNFVFSCNIGIEIATEHSPDDNELFKVSDIDVHDNIVGDCQGWCGLCFGGYDVDLGFTENCKFHNNTFIDNGTQVGVQRSSGNRIYDNLFVDGDSAIEFNSDCKEGDLINDFGENAWCLAGDSDILDWSDAGDYDISNLLPQAAVDKQKIILDRAEAIDGFKSLIGGVGSTFVPSDEYIKLYKSVVSK